MVRWGHGRPPIGCVPTGICIDLGKIQGPSRVWVVKALPTADKPILEDESCHQQEEGDAKDDPYVDRHVVEDGVQRALAGLRRWAFTHIHEEVKVTEIAQAVALEGLFDSLQDVKHREVHLKLRGV